MLGFEEVVLKNGATESKLLVKAIVVSLKDLIAEDCIAFYELVELCKDPNHKLHGETNEILEKLNFTHDGVIENSIRNVVLSAVEGERLSMRLTNPVKK